MLPTMSASGECVVERRWIDRTRLARGDLVTFISPLDPMRVVCKRLIGLPGDIICVDPTGQMAPSTEHVVVPKGHFWMSGDNAELSRDSRQYGPVPMALIKGKLVARVCHFLSCFWIVMFTQLIQVWPLRTAGRFRNNFTYIDE